MNLVVTTYQQNTFCVAGATLAAGNTSTIAYVCLSGDKKGRVRGHFERIWPRNEVEETEAAWRVECQMRAEREGIRVAAAQRVASRLGSHAGD